MKPPQNSFDLERSYRKARKVLLMVWLLVALSIYAIIFVAGRAHSRYLDRLEERLNVVVTIQLLSVSSDITKKIEPATNLTIEECREITIDPSAPVLVGNQTCVCLLEADDRSISHEIRLISGESEMLEVDDEGDGSGHKRSLTSLQREQESS
jgi:hypothetical protein